MRKAAYYLVHTFLYYVAWVLGILLASENRGWEGAAVVLAFAMVQFFLEYKTSKRVDALIGISLLLTAAGVVVDTTWVVTGIAVFNANPFAGYFTPPWMMMLWLSFAIFTYATKPYQYFSLPLLAVFALVGFSLVFAIGAKLHVVLFPYGTYLTCFSIGLVWAI